VVTRAEHISNTISHGAGVVAAIIGAPFLIVAAVRHGGAALTVGVSIFAVTALLLYCASTIYHALPDGRTKDLFEVLDHGAIYLLIAGTYTPFTLTVLSGPLGWTLFGVIWALAAGGVIMKSVRGIQNPIFSTGLYLVMGWLVVVAGHSLWLHLSRTGLLWLIAGGMAYTVGVAFYAAKRMPFGHLVWHLFVLTGTVCHYFAVLSCTA
jgi:hemolysin III